MIRKVAGDEVIGDPNAMSLKGKGREGRRSLKILKVIAEGLRVVVSKNVELFRTGEFVELKEVVLVAFDMVDDPVDGAEVHDAPYGLKKIGVEAVGVGEGKLVFNS